MNEAQAARLRPKGLPRPLAKRSVIDPFIVMAEANARAKTGDDIIQTTLFIWRWGSRLRPHPGRPASGRSKP